MIVMGGARRRLTPSVSETTSRVDALKLHLLRPFMSMPRRLIDGLKFRVFRMVSRSKVRVRVRFRRAVLKVQL
jgi:hypothetical protein